MGQEFSAETPQRIGDAARGGIDDAGISAGASITREPLATYPDDTSAVV